jgi:hypothetical protein
VLAGVGGRTIAEAKERLSYSEALEWSAYMQKRGSLHVGGRVEFSIALLAAMINKALGGSATVRDFIPHAAHQQGSIEDVMSLLAGRK